MDDGSFNSKNGTSRLYTFAYSKDLCYKLRDKLMKLGVNCNVHESKSSSSNNSYWFISFSRIESNKMFEKISKYVHKSMKYKISESFHNIVGSYKWNSEEGNLGGMKVSDKILNYKKDVVYDIEVEDNHNFIICSARRGNVKSETINEGFIAHNCQDVSKLQRYIVTNIVKPKGRLISCGDDKQMLYGFIGADSDSFNALGNMPNTKRLPLSVCYRCGTRIIEEANKVFENSTQSPGWMEEGIVRVGSVDDATDGDFVLCRNNMPLIEVYIRLLKQKKRVHILGKDFGKSLSKLTEKSEELTDDEMILHFNYLLESKEEQLIDRGIESPKSHQSYITLDENIEIVKILKNEYGSFREVNLSILDIFSDERSDEEIILSSIHKSKGLESDRVFIIGKSELIPSKYARTKSELMQEKCVEYVAITRAKKELVYVPLHTI